MFIKRLLSTITVLLGVVSIQGKHASFRPRAGNDIVDVATAAGSFSTLITAVKVAGLEDTLRSTGPFTVFAPTDAAFAKLPAATLNALLADPEALKSVLLYHVVSGKVDAATAITIAQSDKPEAQTVNGAKIALELRDGSLFINEAQVVTADVGASNGVIHVIDTVLTIPSFTVFGANLLGDIVDTTVAAGSFNTLITAVQVAGLESTLRSTGPFTVFAPTDAAFAKLPAATLNALLADPEALKAVLLYHVVSGKVDSTAATKVARNFFNHQVATVNGAKLSLSLRSGALYINNSKVTAADVEATNGIIHVIDTVLIPPSAKAIEAALGDIVDTAVAAGSFNTLVTAVQVAGLESTLRSSGPFTVFAPTDAAFAKLPAATLNALLADPEALKAVLLYHVVSGEVDSPDAIAIAQSKSPRASTVNGADVKLSIVDGSLFINDSKVTTADVKATNGVIHVIDTVLLPPSA
jgi:transforming growth factor-beta-induced protein